MCASTLICKSYSTGRTFDENWGIILTVYHRMIKTGDWSTSELVKYLVAVQSTLSTEESRRLKLTAAFPKESKASGGAPETQKISRFMASDLYEPTDTLRNLGLPILDWGSRSKWRSSSDEGLNTWLSRRYLQLRNTNSEISVQPRAPSVSPS